MLKNLFSNRLFIGALAFFVLMVVGSTLYLQHVEKQSARANERLKVLTEKQQQQPTAEVPVGETSQGGDIHADGIRHTEPHKLHSQASIGTAIRSTAAEGVLEKIGKFNVFENYMSELPLPNQAELETYWTLETLVEGLTEAEAIDKAHKDYQKHLDEYGIPPPPPGYYLRIPIYANEPPCYARENEPYVDLRWTRYGINTDRLSADEWEIYKILKILEPGDTSFTVQPLPETYAAVAEKWVKELEDSTWGPLPQLVEGRGVFDEFTSNEMVTILYQRKVTEIQAAFDRFVGMPSRPPEDGYNIDVQLAGLILDEIENKLATGDR